MSLIFFFLLLFLFFSTFSQLLKLPPLVSESKLLELSAHRVLEGRPSIHLLAPRLAMRVGVVGARELLSEARLGVEKLEQRRPLLHDSLELAPSWLFPPQRKLAAPHKPHHRVVPGAQVISMDRLLPVGERHRWVVDVGQALGVVREEPQREQLMEDPPLAHGHEGKLLAPP